MKKILLPIFAAAAFLSACVPSVNPFYTAKDVVTDPRLAGIWLEAKDNPAKWKFELAANNAYAVALTEDRDKSGKFEGYLFKLGLDFFLDLTPMECHFATNQATLTGAAMIPGHLLVRVQFAESKLNLAFCNPDWLKKFLEKNPAAISHRVVDGNIILTAETDALQRFVRQHLGEDELFGQGSDYAHPAALAAPK